MVIFKIFEKVGEIYLIEVIIILSGGYIIVWENYFISLSKIEIRFIIDESELVLCKEYERWILVIF